MPKGTMPNMLHMIIGLLAFTVVACVASFGVEGVDINAQLACCVDWLDASTLHTDSGTGFGGVVASLASTAAVATKEVKDLLEELQGNIKRIVGEGGLEDQIKAASDDASELKEQVNKISTRNAEIVDQIEDNRKSMEDRLDELELKIKDGNPVGVDRPNYGAKMVEAVTEAGVTPSNATKHTTINVDLDGVGIADIVSTKAITNAPASGGSLVDPDYQDDIVAPPLRTPSIVNLLNVVPTSKDSIEYVRQSAETSNAAPQAGQGAALAESSMAFTLETEAVETLGHYIMASVQILDDAPRLQAFVNGRMRRLTQIALENQVLTGDGTSQNLNGLLPNASTYDAALENIVGGAASDLDKIRLAMLQLQQKEFVPSGIVLPPVNWAAIEMTKTSEGAYIFVNPQNATTPRLWGLPVVGTTAMTSTEGLVADFQEFATYYDRQGLTVQLSTEDRDNFIKLLVTIRAILRGTLAVEQPNAGVHITSLSDPTAV